MVPMHAQKRERALHEPPFGLQALAGPDRLKAGLQTTGAPPKEQFMVPVHGIKGVEARDKSRHPGY